MWTYYLLKDKINKIWLNSTTENVAPSNIITNHKSNEWLCYRDYECELWDTHTHTPQVHCFANGTCGLEIKSSVSDPTGIQKLL